MSGGGQARTDKAGPPDRPAAENDRRPHRRLTTGGIITLVSAIPVALGAYAAWQEYLHQVDLGKINKTIQFYERFNSDPVLPARQKLLHSVLEQQSRNKEILQSGSDAWRDYVISLVRQEGLVPELMIMVEFFDALHVCVREQICKERASTQLFRPYAVDLIKYWGSFFAYLDEEFGAEGDFTRSLEYFALRSDVESR